MKSAAGESLKPGYCDVKSMVCNPLEFERTARRNAHPSDLAVEILLEQGWMMVAEAAAVHPYGSPA
jgi:hypothetical protein